MDNPVEGSVRIELFGPFRKFGAERDLSLGGPVRYEELLAAIEADLGPAFGEQARRTNTTVIVNNRIASRKSLETLKIVPGDRVAFALLMGGG
jgi:molybdopterin converting factor small subunit